MSKIFVTIQKQAIIECYPIECNKQHQRYCVSRRNLLISGDIELNPGPLPQGNNTMCTVSQTPSMVLLQSRLNEQGLRS